MSHTKKHTHSGELLEPKRNFEAATLAAFSSVARKVEGILICMRTIQIVLLTLIIIGVGLLFTQEYWVPQLVSALL